MRQNENALCIHDGCFRGVKEITPPIFEDYRGSYSETFNDVLYRELAYPDVSSLRFVQDDISKSFRGVLRGIHGDEKTWKLVQCLKGAIQTVLVDCREGSMTLHQWHSYILSDANRLQLLIPPGIGNSTLTLTEDSIYHYKQSSYYGGMSSQFTIAWDDPNLDILWAIDDPIVSKRDSEVENDILPTVKVVYDSAT